MREIIWMRVYKPNLNILELWFWFFGKIVKFPKDQGQVLYYPGSPQKNLIIVWDETASCDLRNLKKWKNKRDSMATDT